jgi:hypothetical protein
MFKLCTNKNHSYKHNEQLNNQNIDNSECVGVKNFKVYPDTTSQYFFEKNMVLVDYIGICLHTPILCVRMSIQNYRFIFVNCFLIWLSKH